MDKYEIIEMIGEGSFGKVFLAKGEEDSRQCVIKEISLTKVNHYLPFTDKNILFA